MNFRSHFPMFTCSPQIRYQRLLPDFYVVTLKFEIPQLAYFNWKWNISWLKKTFKLCNYFFPTSYSIFRRLYHGRLDRLRRNMSYLYHIVPVTEHLTQKSGKNRREPDIPPTQIRVIFTWTQCSFGISQHSSFGTCWHSVSGACSISVTFIIYSNPIGIKVIRKFFLKP